MLARLPHDFTDIFTDASAADAAAVRAELGRNQRALQAGLILGRPQAVADRLVSWVLPVCLVITSRSTSRVYATCPFRLCYHHVVLVGFSLTARPSYLECDLLDSPPVGGSGIVAQACPAPQYIF